jgi:hypothetical protein
MYISLEDFEDGSGAVWGDGGGDGNRFFYGGHIPEGAKLWFKGAVMHEVATNKIHVAVRIYVEGDSEFSVANLWRQNGAEWQRADAARAANGARKVLTVVSSLRRDRIKVELLHRLRWDILGGVEDIQV